MIKNLPGKINDESAGERNKSVEVLKVSPQVIRNILAFSKALKVEKTSLVGKITHLAN